MTTHFDHSSQRKGIKDQASPLATLSKASLLGVLLFGSIHVNAQLVTLHVKNERIPDILNDLRKKAKYSFFYNKNLNLKNYQRTINISKKPLSFVLDQIFEGLPLRYEIANQTIVIRAYNEPTKYVVTNPNNRASIKVLEIGVRGRVIDELGNAVEGVKVENTTTKVFTFTNKNGEFAIPTEHTGRLAFTESGEFYKKEVSFSSPDFISIKMEHVPVSMDSVIVKSNQFKKKDPTKFVDLTNRQYMNLGQVLQGTIPGLSLQYSSASTKKVDEVGIFQHYQNGTTTNIDAYNFMSVEDFLNLKGQTEGQAIINALLQNPHAYDQNGLAQYSLKTSNQITNTLVPQIRGVNSFSSSNQGMLVIIDGFPQDDFPSTYPMTNVESIEVVKDPKELIKWGPKAAGGAILITTKKGNKGVINVNYNANFYYSPATKFNEKRMQLADTKDYLDYMKDYNQTYSTSSLGLNYAQRLLSEYKEAAITQDQFNNSWDSLGNYDNESQIKYLQQNAFSQNHTLSVNGGNQLYKFSFIGNYYGTQSNSLNSNSKAEGFNWNNHFDLLKHKLNIDWLIKYTHTNAKSGYTYNPYDGTLEPWQRLLDNNGNYVYDESTLSPDYNNKILSYGYKDYGVNILQDARLNNTFTSTNLLQTRYNMKWQLLPILNWSTSIYFRGQTTNTNTFYDKESSYGRQMFDKYTDYSGGQLISYLPYGDINHASKNKTKELNIRSGLSLSKTFGKHTISAAIGGGMANVVLRQPGSLTMYGYDKSSKKGTPVLLPASNPEGSINNFFQFLGSNASASSIPYNLIQPSSGDTTITRNLNWNASLSYQFGNRITVNGTYNSVLNPLYGQSNPYSTTSNYTVDATGLIYENRKAHSVVSKMSVSVGGTGMLMPTLPVSYSNSRYYQTNWDNYTIWVSGLNPTQQQGQKTTNIYEKFILDLFSNSIQLNAAFNDQKINGSTSSFTTSSSTASDTSYSTRYMSAGLKAFLRKSAFTLNANYSKSPEGQSQLNGGFNYNITKETYFHSKRISTLELNGSVETISSYQATGMMMGTNVASGGSYSMATNSSFNSLPPKNKNTELHAAIGLNDDKQMFDVRYYNHSTSGLNSYTSSYTDPSTGLSSQTTYSTIINKGVEFFFKTSIIKNKDFHYDVTLNGAYNVNIAHSVPTTAFAANSSYATAKRDGYNVNNIWAFNWAGLDNQGDPQIYDHNGNVTNVLDSATLSNAMVYKGVTNAPWTGGFIHEFGYKQFFARAAITFKWGYLMKRYIPAMNSDADRSVLTKYRWKEAGDEAHTDIAAISLTGNNTYRSFVIENSSNGLLSGNNIRLQEIMCGWSATPLLSHKLGVKSFQVTLQMQNVALWTQNKLHVDPSIVGTNGQIGLPLPKMYSCTLMVGF